MPGFPYQPNYIEINGLRIHYIDEGEGEVILCVHGEPTWSYLYRKMIPRLAGNCRVVAMDFVGFGRSDKFTEPDEYTTPMHCDTLIQFIDKLSLHDITLVVHDWGGPIGLNVATQNPDRIARLVVMNTGLSDGSIKPGKGFMQWRKFVEKTPDLPLGLMAGQFTVCDLSDEEMYAYDAPFPDVSYKVGAQIWPLQVPMSPDEPDAEINRQTIKALSQWDKPTLVLFSVDDPILGNLYGFFRNLIPAAKNEPEGVIKGAGHFPQEDKPEETARHILDFIARRPLKS